MLILLWVIISLGVATVAMMVGTLFGSVILIGLYTALIVMAQIFATKLVLFGPWVVPAGVIVYGVSFLVTDALSEFYSKQEALKAVVCGLVGSIILVIGLQIVIVWPAPPFWKNQQALETLLGTTRRIVLGSMLAYLMSQNWDVFLFHFIRDRTGEKHLWFRNCASTMTSQLIDTVVFIFVAFLGAVPFEMLMTMVLGQYITKLIIALLDTPFLYFLKAWFRKEGRGII